ncbi:MAG: phosphoribosylglycinamide formyltransferase [Oscillospiraceae bacterium]
MLNPVEKARIAVLVSGGGTNLQALLDAETQGNLPSGTIVLVISSREGVLALERAKNAGIPAAVVSRRDSPSQEDFEARLEALLTEAQADMIVLAGFLSILSGDFTARWQRRILNVHPALLPAFCGKGNYGLKVHEAVLARGVKVTGATVHFVNEIPDGGEILLQKAVEVLPGDTAESLQRRVMEQAEWQLLPRGTELVAAEIVREKRTVR